MKAIYDYWADELEPGLRTAESILGFDLDDYVKKHKSNN